MKEILNYISNPDANISVIGSFVNIVCGTKGCIYNVEDCKEIIEPYIQKYNINNYVGDIHLFQENFTTYIFYKNKLLSKIIKDDIIANYENITEMLCDLLCNENEINQISFEIKEKDILNKLKEFYKYIIIKPQITRQWLENNIKPYKLVNKVVSL